MTDAPTPNRRVSPGWVSAVALLLAHIVGIGVVYGGLAQRVAALENRTAPLEAGSLVRLETQMVQVQSALGRIEERMERDRR